MTRAGGDGGFTLLELLVVLAVLGVAAALAGPAIRPGGGPGTAIRTATAETIEQLATARESAVRDNRVHCIALAEDTPPACTPLRLPRGVTARGDRPVIRFHRDGSSSGLRLALSTGAMTRTVTVIGATGQVLAR